MHYHSGFARIRILSHSRRHYRGDSEVNLIAHALIRRRPERVTSEPSIEIYLVLENMQNFFCQGTIWQHFLEAQVHGKIRYMQDTVAPACKVSILSKENLPYKQADLTSGL